MDGIKQLKRDALLKRNAAILKAKREYHAALKAIRALEVTLSAKQPFDASDFLEMKPGKLARQILLEGEPMTTAELTLEVQRRGCRTLEDPRVVGKLIRQGMRYHAKQFRKDEKGRWSMVRVP